MQFHGYGGVFWVWNIAVRDGKQVAAETGWPYKICWGGFLSGTGKQQSAAVCQVLHGQTAWAAASQELWGEGERGFVQVREWEVFPRTEGKVFLPSRAWEILLRFR